MNERAAAIVRELSLLEQRRAELFVELVALSEPADELLTVEDVAQVMKTTTDWLYRHAAQLPFTVRPGPGQVRFSKNGLQEYLKQRSRK